MKYFDPDALRLRLLGETGYNFYLNRSFDQSERLGGLASSAHGDLAEAIKCLLVGFNKPAQDLLNKAQEWLQISIDKEEHSNYYFADGTEAFRYYDMAIINWLLTGKHDQISMGKYLEYELRYLEGDVINDTFAISCTLPKIYDAGTYREALNIFDKTPKLRPPTVAKNVRNPAKMIYIMCKNKLNNTFLEDYVIRALKSFLTNKLNDWLVNGHYDRVVNWMKIAYWNENPDQLTPKDAILKCYDHLPGVDPPENINNNK